MMILMIKIMWKFPAACHLENNGNGDGDGEDDQDRKKQNPLIFLPSAAAHQARCCPRFGNLPPWRVNKHLDMKLLSLSKHG